MAKIKLQNTRDAVLKLKLTTASARAPLTPFLLKVSYVQILSFPPRKMKVSLNGVLKEREREREKEREKERDR